MGQTEHFFTNGKHCSEEGIALYVDALKLERTAELPEKILRHVAECQRCMRDVTGLYALLMDQDYFRTGPHPYFDRQVESRGETRFPIYRIAAGFAIVLALGAVVYLLSYLKGTRETPGSLANQSRIVAVDTGAVKEVPERTSRVHRPVPKTEDLAARFEESPDLEGLVGAELRSAEVRILSPSIGQTGHGEVSFRWDSGFKPPFTLTVLSNRGVVRKEVGLAEPHYTLSERLEDGSYYWKMVADGELLYVGKFLVKSH
jgi:hypothetical protein